METVDPDPTPAYDLPKARSAMKECQVGLAYLRDKEIGDDDWEDKVNKSGAPLATVLFLREMRYWRRCRFCVRCAIDDAVVFAWYMLLAVVLLRWACHWQWRVFA